MLCHIEYRNDKFSNMTVINHLTQEFSNIKVINQPMQEFSNVMVINLPTQEFSNIRLIDQSTQEYQCDGHGRRRHVRNIAQSTVYKKDSRGCLAEDA